MKNLKNFWKNFGIWAFFTIGVIVKSIIKFINIIKNSDEVSDIFSSWDFYFYVCISILGIMYISSLFFVEDEENIEVQCPKCKVRPYRAGMHWACDKCKQGFDTFKHFGKCPKCNHEHKETMCLSCEELSNHLEFYPER